MRLTMLTPNHALQRTRRERRGCNRGVPRAESLSLGRSSVRPTEPYFPMPQR